MQKAFDALLPHETVEICKQTCINIAVQRALIKVDEWRTTNLKGIGKIFLVFNIFALNYLHVNFQPHFPFSFLLLCLLFMLTHTNTQIEIFSKDIQADVENVMKKSKTNQTTSTTTFEIDLTKRSPWQVLDELQFNLHMASITPYRVTIDAIETLMDDLYSCVIDHRLLDAMCRSIGTMAIYLLQLLGE